MSRTRYSWDELIPVEEAQVAAKFLIDTWDQCCQGRPQEFKFTRTEPRLTESLFAEVHRLKANSGLTGFWTNESQYPRVQNGIITRTKTDIQYQSNIGMPIELVFEFKKLKKRGMSYYRNKQGMRRFVDGHYAMNQPLAAMVAILEPGSESELPAKLIRSLLNIGARDDLRMVQSPTGKYIRIPSETLDAVAKFDTEHSRPEDQAPRNGTTTLAHIFICGTD